MVGMPKVLIVEDEVSLARAMRDALAAEGHEVKLQHVGEKVLETFHNFTPNVILMDVRLGGVSGLDLLEQITRESTEVEVIVITAYGSVEVAVDAMKRGASEFLTKPIDLDVLTVAVNKVWSSSRARRQLEQFRSAQAERLRQVEFLGESPPIVTIREQVDRLAQRTASSGGQTPSILLTGETGTGKDLLATYIHAALPHRDGPLVALNCSAVPSELFESELFGHKRGAFSGATEDKAGLFETADGGTLFLDEIGDLPMPLQPKLLRALETQTIRRVGETRDRGFNVCLIAATNRDPQTAITTGRLREDLYYRLRVVAIELPPLRERGDDILLIADRFCEQLAAKYAIPDLHLSEEARRVILDHTWPGNVRELRHALESAALSIAGNEIHSQDLPLPANADPVRRAESSLDAGRPIRLEDVEKSLIERALRATGGNASAAARLLSIGREAMRYRMAKFNLTAPADSDAEHADSENANERGNE